MKTSRRVALGVAILASGLAAEAAVERVTRTDRPPLKRPLASIPMELGDWVGRDEPVDPQVAAASQATEYINRVYTRRGHPREQVWLWMNYSETGLNLRHSPEVCLPSGGWEKAEAMTRVIEVERPDGSRQPISLLGYAKDELVQRIGFWYYIFGEGRVERLVRELPITSRSSHGRTTRGSGLTVEVFYPGEAGLDDEALGGFVAEVLAALGPCLPDDRAGYHIP